MRPTRWTRKKRVTYFGKGGWHLGRYGIGYTDPITGNGFDCDWRNVRRVPQMRREVNDHERTLWGRSECR